MGVGTYVPLIGVVVSGLGLGLAWWRGRSNSIWYKVIENQAVLALGRERLGGLKLVKGEREITSAHALAVQFFNEGARAIESSDFVDRFAIRVQQGSRLLEAVPLEGDDLVPISYTFGREGLEIDGVLLNPGEGFGVRLMIEEVKLPLAVRMRIRGARDLYEALFHPRDWWKYLWVTVAAVAVGSSVLGVMIQNGAFSGTAIRGANQWLFILVLVCMVITVIGGLMCVGGHPALARLRLLRGYTGALKKAWSTAPMVSTGGGLEVVTAHYGAQNAWRDVTQRIKDAIENGQLRIEVTNSVLGDDPVPGQRKSLRVVYMRNGESLTREVSEGESLVLP